MITSLNNRFIVEAYKEDRALRAQVTNAFAMVEQKVSLKGLKTLAEARIVQGNQTFVIPKGITVYVKESLLQSAPWAKQIFTSDATNEQFMIIDAQFVEFFKDFSND